MARAVREPKQLPRKKKAAIVKLARAGMDARQIAKRTGERTDVVRTFLQSPTE